MRVGRSAIRRAMLCAFALLAACGRSGTEAPEPAPPARLSTADLIITARVVNTGVAGAPPAEAVAVRNGRIAAVDKANRKVSVQGAQETVDFTVNDPALLKELAVGDGVVATFIRSVKGKVEFR